MELEIMTSSVYENNRQLEKKTAKWMDLIYTLESEKKKAFGLKRRNESLVGWLEVLEHFRQGSSMYWGPEAEKVWYTAGGNVADMNHWGRERGR